MNATLLTKSQLEIRNRRTLRYPLQIAEKDYLLAYVMQLISFSALSQDLVFKGGTALYHCYLDQYRFSEDLDFSTLNHTINFEHVQDVFSNTPFLSIKKYHLSKATIKIERLQYFGPLTFLNSLKVEIDNLQNVLLKPKIRTYQNVWGLDFKVSVMDEREICAEKIRAMSDRARYRDFYDLYMLRDKYQPNINEIIDYIKQKEIRQPISKSNILQNWKIIRTQKEIDRDQIYYSRKVDDAIILRMIDDLPITEISHSI